jgi:hypothetical protein
MSDVKVGHDSTGWCNLANIAFQTGGAYSAAGAAQIQDASGLWPGLLDDMRQLLPRSWHPDDQPADPLEPVAGGRRGQREVRRRTCRGGEPVPETRIPRREFEVPEFVA